MDQQDETSAGSGMMKGIAAARWYLCGIGVALMLVGGLFCGLLWRSYARAREMSQWPEVDCVILKSEVAERRIGAAVPPEWSFAVLYGYEWQGQPHESERYSLRGSPWSGEPAAAEELVRIYPLGTTVKCRVNPADPSVAVLKTDTKAAGYSLWFPALFVVGGGGIVAGALRRRVKPK